MSETKFTPGPWNWMLVKPVRHIYVKRRTGLLAHSGFVACTYGADTNRLTDSDDEANANLIAAAPELFTALDEALKAYDSAAYDSDEFILLAQAFHFARAALRKARGEQ